MNITVAQKVKTGIFVVISLALLLALVFLIGKHQNLFGSTFYAHANFKNIAGLKEGNFVRFAGIDIGTVDNIAVVNDTTVRVVLSLRKNIQPYIKEDAIASIGSDGLMGDKLIMIAPGSSANTVKDGGVLKASNPVDIDRVMNNLTRISDNAEAITGGLANIVSRINNGEGTIGRLVADDKLADRMEATLQKTTETVGTIKKTANSVNDNMEAAKSSFLLRGYFKKKERKRIKDSIDNAKKLQEQSIKKNK
jgi:phospholipid/cholesterol/gamma-HCH transport system substrate-binding protein